jgi:hypothetical protein
MCFRSSSRAPPESSTWKPPQSNPHTSDEMHGDHVIFTLFSHPLQSWSCSFLSDLLISD